MSSKDNSKAKPASIRARLKFPTEQAFVEKYAPNISKTGIFVKTPRPKAVGTTIRFEFQIADGTPVLRGAGEVVWTRAEASDGQPAGMGIKFHGLDARGREMLDRVLQFKQSVATAPQNPSRFSIVPAPADESEQDDVESISEELQFSPDDIVEAESPKDAGDSASQPEESQPEESQPEESQPETTAPSDEAEIEASADEGQSEQAEPVKAAAKKRKRRTRRRVKSEKLDLGEIDSMLAGLTETGGVTGSRSHRRRSSTPAPQKVPTENGDVSVPADQAPTVVPEPEVIGEFLSDGLPGPDETLTDLDLSGAEQDGETGSEALDPIEDAEARSEVTIQAPRVAEELDPIEDAEARSEVTVQAPRVAEELDPIEDAEARSEVTVQAKDVARELAESSELSDALSLLDTFSEEADFETETAVTVKNLPDSQEIEQILDSEGGENGTWDESKMTDLLGENGDFDEDASEYETGVSMALPRLDAPEDREPDSFGFAASGGQAGNRDLDQQFLSALNEAMDDVGNSEMPKDQVSNGGPPGAHPFASDAPRDDASAETIQVLEEIQEIVDLDEVEEISDLDDEMIETEFFDDIEVEDDIEDDDVRGDPDHLQPTDVASELPLTGPNIPLMVREEVAEALEDIFTDADASDALDSLIPEAPSASEIALQVSEPVISAPEPNTSSPDLPPETLPDDAVPPGLLRQPPKQKEPMTDGMFGTNLPDPTGSNIPVPEAESGSDDEPSDDHKKGFFKKLFGG